MRNSSSQIELFENFYSIYQFDPESKGSLSHWVGVEKVTPTHLQRKGRGEITEKIHPYPS